MWAPLVLLPLLSRLTRQRGERPASARTALRRPSCRPVLEDLEHRVALTAPGPPPIIPPPCSLERIITDPNLVFSVPYVSKPAYLTPVTDPIFGTTITRIAGDPGTSFTTANDGTGTWSLDARHMYAKDQPWNADGRLLAIENRLDGGGTPNELFLDGNTYQVKYGTPSNLPYGGGGDERWVYRPGHPNERLVAGWPGNTLYWFDVVRNVVTRSWNLPVAVVGIGMSEGNTSQDGRFVALSDSAGHLFVVDMDPQAPFNSYPNQRLGPVYDLSADGVMQSGWDIDWVSVSPSGKYVVVEYNTPTGDAERVFDVNPTTLVLTPHRMPVSYQGQVGSADQGFIYSMGHGDLALNPFDDNRDVMIGQEACGNVGVNVPGIPTVNGNGVGHVVMVRLRDNAVVALTDPGNGTTVAYEAYAFHISTRNVDRPGWAYVSYFRQDGRRFSDEVLAVRLDGSGSVERLAQYHSVYNLSASGYGGLPPLDEFNYRSEPHAVPSPNGRRVLFASNWMDQGDGGFSIQDYVVDARRSFAEDEMAWNLCEEEVWNCDDNDPDPGKPHPRMSHRQSQTYSCSSSASVG